MHYLRHRRALRKQGGFIQGAILFALVIIAVVVAAFSLANRDSQNNADTEHARVNASYVLKVGNDIQTAVNRAIADGMAPSDVNANLLLMGATAAPALSIFDPDVKYLVRPQFPKTALQVDDQPFTSTVTARQPNWALSAITGVGGNDKELVLQIPNIKQIVCQRINASANGLIVVAAPPADLAAIATAGYREGCFGSGTTFTYFRTVVTDAQS
jgi:hypothetical protein